MSVIKRTASEAGSSTSRASTPLAKRPRGLIRTLTSFLSRRPTPSEASSSRPPSANSNIYPELPIQSGVLGASDRPIEVDDDDFEPVVRQIAGPSRARPRPNLDDQYIINDYSQLGGDVASTTVSRRRRDGKRRINKRVALRSARAQHGGGERQEQKYRQGRKIETDFLAERKDWDGKRGVSRFAELVKNIPRKVTQTFVRAPRVELASHRETHNLDDILERLQLQEEEAEARIRQALRPSIPDELAEEEEDLVDSTFADRSFKKIIGGKAQIEAKSISRLRPGTWLNDEIVNAYMTMLQLRADADDTLPKIHAFNSFFYEKMSSQGYSKMLARWTKKVKIFEKDIILFPINLGNTHWVAGAIDMRNKRVDYFDSMGTGGMGKDEAFDIVMTYLAREWEDKGHPGKFDESEWTLRVDSAAPRQDNGVDCGVFSCQTLEAVSRGLDIAGGGAWEFGPANMGFMRRMMVWEIAQGQLYKRW